MKTPNFWIMVLLPALFLTAWSPGVAAQRDETLGELLQRLSASPTIEQVQRAAVQRAELDPRRARQLIARVRAAGILPRLEVSLSKGLSRDEDLDMEYLEWDELSLATDQDLDFEVSLRWDLDRLIYDSEELRARREATFLAERRRELLLAVTRMYFELLSLRAQSALTPLSGNDDGAAERTLRIAELIALLDGLTGGLMRRQSSGASRSL